MSEAGDGQLDFIGEPERTPEVKGLEATLEKNQSLRDDFVTTFTSPQGERVLRYLLDNCGYSKSTFRPDPYQMAFLEGRRDVGLQILYWLEMDDGELARRIFRRPTR